jgi:hypothetical protein
MTIQGGKLTFFNDAVIRQDRIQRRTGVPFGKHEPIATFHFGVLRVEAKVTVVENDQGIDGRKTAAEMPYAECSDSIEGQIPDFPTLFLEGSIGIDGHGVITTLSAPSIRLIKVSIAV